MPCEINCRKGVAEHRTVYDRIQMMWEMGFSQRVFFFIENVTLAIFLLHFLSQGMDGCQLPPIHDGTSISAWKKSHKHVEQPSGPQFSYIRIWASVCNHMNGPLLK